MFTGYFKDAETNMVTDHAVQRIKQRVKGIPPRMVKRQINGALRDGTVPVVAWSRDRCWIGTMVLETGQRIYPVISPAGAVITVYKEGARVETDQGHMNLEEGRVRPQYQRSNENGEKPHHP
ncbi:hypothetical protein [Mesobacterium pallidum]|uniref:hypothetical protein n=1 Tax=Mesobacterium pallidum TaxID=2872037 RepID=UPI001EE33211|nr:hypothetical protein [Mesobacterium pallidum]